ncbi:MAG: hypothetical protein A2Y15_07345 [Clostridiales bacterium GWF2_36_10]|nr:MAG: hypothetical protein A2Y15_07345 [Clostridiales bacterium GWF2_36_10]HAN21300.1 hypothetical protein [Clostridiales bacterium]
MTIEAKKYIDNRFDQLSEQYQTIKITAPTGIDLESLAKQFNSEMFRIYSATKNEVKYNAGYFFDLLNLIVEYGPQNSS